MRGAPGQLGLGPCRSPHTAISVTLIGFSLRGLSLGIMTAVGGEYAQFCTVLPERHETPMNTGEPRSRYLCGHHAWTGTKERPGLTPLLTPEVCLVSINLVGEPHPTYIRQTTHHP